MVAAMSAQVAARPHLTPREVFEAVAPVVPGIADSIIRARGGRGSRERDDMVQEGLLELWRISGKYDPQLGGPKSFAKARVRGAMIEWLRSRCLVGLREETAAIKQAAGRFVPVCLPIGTPGDDERQVCPTTIDAEIADDDAAEIASAIRRTGAELGSAEYVTLLTWLVSEKPHQGIADEAGVSKSTVTHRLASATDKIRRAMEARGMTSFD